MAQHQERSSGIWNIAPWFVSAVIVMLVVSFSLLVKGDLDQKEDDVTVRKIDVALPPPPPPEPPVKPRTSPSNSPSPSVDLLGQSNGPAFEFSPKAELSLDNLEKVEAPEFDTSKLDLRKTLSLDFPIVEVKQLDEVPHAISTVSIRYPRSLVKRGIKRVDTQVELIIDQQGRAYIKKIVDPVYPEMIEPIRKWVKNVKFSIPTKDGRPIQAIYPYTIRFIYRV